MKAALAEFNQLACGVLRGECPAWPFGADVKRARLFSAFCDYHGVGPLLYGELVDTAVLARWHGEVREHLMHQALALSALELQRKHEIQRVSRAFAEHGVQGLLLKGGALAYVLYKAPVLRTRTDTDILVAPGREHRAGEVLQHLGYRRPLAIDGAYIKSQAQYLYEGVAPGQTIDLHWRLTNNHVFADTLSFAELSGEAKTLDWLGPALGIPNRGSLLLHACIHRATNLPAQEGNRLIWLYDIHLLAAELEGADWQCFVESAVDKRLAAICADSLTASTERFDTKIPEGIIPALAALRSRHELSAQMVDASPLKARILNYRALPTWRARALMLKEQLFPSVAFMRKRYGVQGGIDLAGAYGRRIWMGLR